MSFQWRLLSQMQATTTTILLPLVVFIHSYEITGAEIEREISRCLSMHGKVISILLFAVAYQQIVNFFISKQS